jgi:hypothetical protein
MGRVLVILCAVLFLMTGTARSQDLSSSSSSSSGPDATERFDIPALTLEQDGQLITWLAEIKKWQQYDEKWRNRPVHNGWAQIVERRPVPAAPEWLTAHCEMVHASRLDGFDERVEIACRVLDDPRASFAAVPVPLSAAPDAESTSVWWTSAASRCSGRRASCC